MKSELRDPQKEYYAQNYDKQPQTYPGIQSQMHPQPDSDAQNYEGRGLLKGRRALITGGDSGIGRSVAIHFAKEGANVAIQYLPAEEQDARDVEKIIKAIGTKVFLLSADFRQEQEPEAVVQRAAEKLGGLDILVLNAAIQQHVNNIDDLSMQQVKDTFQVNIISMYAAVKKALAFLPKGSSIITSTSLEAFNPTPILLDYAATKAAIVSFTTNLAKALADRGIRVNGVAPGPVWTPLQVCGGQPQSAITSFGSEVPLKRAGQPDELAPTYVFLASNLASYTTGQIYGVTGGTPINS